MNDILYYFMCQNVFIYVLCFFQKSFSNNKISQLYDSKYIKNNKKLCFIFFQIKKQPDISFKGG